MNTKRDVIENFYIGQGIAERETDTLAGYFFQTTHWVRVFSGDVDIILGPKGSGKSAIYFLLKQKEAELEQRGIYLVAAENPQGEPVFRQVSKTPPSDEAAFMFLWKLYFLVLVVKKLSIVESCASEIEPIKEILQAEGLLPAGFSLARALKSVLDYISSKFHFSSIETGVELDPLTGLPKFTGKISLGTPSERERKLGITSVEELLAQVNAILAKSNSKVWVVLDRLDVVFEEDRNVERVALRSLFRTYNDFFSLDNVSLKIFLRDDIWKTISEGGFREASHFVRRVDLTWNRNSLVNMLVRRLVALKVLLECFSLDPAQMLGVFSRQVVFFNSLFPEKINLFGGLQKDSLDWIMFSTKDGNGINTPREVIELLNFARDHEMSRLERGENVARANILFGQEAMFAGIRKVAKYKLEQTLFSEYPEIKKFVDPLYNRKRHRYGVADLTAMWKQGRPEVQKIAAKLAEVGFFRREENSYVIPHFYGYALGIGARDPGGLAQSVSDSSNQGEEVPSDLQMAEPIVEHMERVDNAASRHRRGRRGGRRRRQGEQVTIEPPKEG